ncbi:hypothetical protein ACOMHN_067736 [Nucella lapillus]
MRVPLLQITPHSAQSMMARFRKVIMEQLDSYNIPDSWKTCLTGDLVRYAKTARAKGGGENKPSENEVMDTLSKWIRTDRLSPQPSTSKAAQSRQGDPPTAADVRVSNDSLEEVEEEETDDSFDQNLMEMAHPGQQDVTDETGTESKQTEPESGRVIYRERRVGGGGGGRGEEEVTEDTPPHRCQIPTRCASAGHATPSTSSTLLYPVTPPIYRDAVLSASSHSEAGASPSPSRENEKCERHKEKKTKRMTALGVIRTLSEEFDLTLKEARALFWRNGGHVNATRYWIMTGDTLPGHHYWSPEEDRVLLTREPDHPHWQRVEGLHGLTAVLHRIQWLQADQ